MRSQFESTILAPIFALSATLALLEVYFFGGFMKYLRIASVIKYAYNLNSDLEPMKPEDPNTEDDGNKLGFCYLSALFFKAQSMFSCFLNNKWCMSKRQTKV